MRPDFWDDSLVAQLPDSVRLFYIGLWCVADNAGYLEWDFAKIGAVLMPYRAVAARERLAAKYGAALVDADERVKVLECGKHAVIQTLEAHRIAGGNKNYRIRESHNSVCFGRAMRGRPARPFGTGKTVGNQVKDIVRARDRDACRFCGKVADNLIFEHVDNLGLANAENIVQACRSCNTKKGTRSVEDAGMTLAPEPEPGSTYLLRPSTDLSTDKSRSESLSPSPSDSESVRRGALVSPFGERMAANGLKGELVQ